MSISFWLLDTDIETDCPLAEKQIRIMCLLNVKTYNRGPGASVKTQGLVSLVPCDPDYETIAG